MQNETRLLVRHFVRGYLSTDLGGGERQAALSAALLFSPSLFIIIVLASKYVMTPFPVPGHSALAGFADRLLIFGGSMVILGLCTSVSARSGSPAIFASMVRMSSSRSIRG